jgi:hypothetical protein
MGQYYKPTAVGTGQFVYSHSYDNGLKLMEHSWIGNNFVGAVETLITKGGEWFGKPIVWAGDYADPEIDKNGETLKHIYEGKEYETNLYDLCKTELKPAEPGENHKPLRFLKNLDTKEFVDLNKVPVSDTWNDNDYRIHPLPLLTCEGNGRGGGDFRGNEKDLVGKWARNRVVIQKSKPKNCKEIIFDLVE